jgi:alkanesulfonate monooxygenase SsuD/methylene tetrahydromethanopterin reductase-like flavin-dependent oxidoreductase (luciferase family)
MSSCIDVLSHGRLIVGVGAGWYQHEYEAYGYHFGDVPERLRMLRDAIQVLKAMWTQERAEFEGRYYQVRGAINEPKPVQRPHPPLWIGGSGEKVTLKLVAQFGDACNLGGDLETLRHKLEVLRGHCENVGRDYETIVKSHTINVVVGSDKAEADRIVTETARRMGEDPEAVRSQFGAFIGQPETGLCGHPGGGRPRLRVHHRLPAQHGRGGRHPRLCRAGDPAGAAGCAGGRMTWTSLRAGAR